LHESEGTSRLIKVERLSLEAECLKDLFRKIEVLPMIEKTVRTGFVLLVLLVLAERSFCNFPPFNGKWKGEITSRFTDSENLESRILFEYGGLKLLATEIRNGNNSTIHGLGFSSHVFTYGPLKTDGFLKEWERPHGYSPGSSVFTEETGIGLDTSLSPVGRYGAVLSVVPEHFMLFFMRKRGEQDCTAGGMFKINPYDFIRMDSLLVLTEYKHGPSVNAKEDTWFLSTPFLTDGYILSASGKVQIEVSNYSISLAGALSGGNHLSPGVFTRVYMSYISKLFSTALFAGGSSPEYWLPEGGYPEEELAGGGALNLFPDSAVEPGFEFAGKLLRLSPVPSPYRKSELSYSFKPKIKAGFFMCTPLWRRKYSLLPTGDILMEEKIEEELKFTGKKAGITLKVGVIRTNIGTFGITYKGDLLLSPDPFNFNISSSIDAGKEIEINGRFRIDLRLKTGSIFFSLYTREGIKVADRIFENPTDFFDFSMGWKMQGG